MKKLGIGAAVIGTVALLLWTVALALDLETKIHYLRARLGAQKTPDVIAVGTASNWLSQDDSGRALAQGLGEQIAPIDHPPKRIVVDGDIFTIHYTNRSDLLRHWCTAEVVMRDQQIWLPRDESGREIRQSVLHELMHVALYKAGGEYQHAVLADSGDGEPVVNPASRMLLTILRDNPRLVKWLTTSK